MARFDVGDDLIAELQLLEAACGGNDQLRPTVSRIGTALDIAELLELVDQPADHLLVSTGDPSQLGRTDAVLVEVGEHGPVTRMEIVITSGGESREELLLEREGELAGEYSQVRVPFLPLAASLGGSHKPRK